MFNLRQMECLVALDDRRNFSHAADQVGMTQSALTQTIQRLEKQFDVKLFSREKGQIAPTDYGEILIKTARQMLTANQTASREIELLRNMEAGEVIIGADPQLGGAVLSESLLKMYELYPNMRFHTVSGDWDAMRPELAVRNIDLYFGFPHKQKDKRFREEPFIIKPPLILCAPFHPAATIKSGPLQDFLECRWISPRPPEWAMDWFREKLGNPELEINELPYYVWSDDLHMVKQMVQSGMGMMGAYEQDVRQELDAGTLVELHFDNWPTSNEIVITTLIGRTLPASALELIHQLKLAIRKNRV